MAMQTVTRDGGHSETVSDLQHSGNIWPLAFFPPMECRIGPASYLARVAKKGWSPRAGPPFSSA
jgi:hypothetical protein